MRVFKRLNRFVMGTTPSAQVLTIENLTGTPVDAGNYSEGRSPDRSATKGRSGPRSGSGRTFTNGGSATRYAEDFSLLVSKSPDEGHHVLNIARESRHKISQSKQKNITPFLPCPNSRILIFRTWMIILLIGVAYAGIYQRDLDLAKLGINKNKLGRVARYTYTFTHTTEIDKRPPICTHAQFDPCYAELKEEELCNDYRNAQETWSLLKKEGSLTKKRIKRGVIFVSVLIATLVSATILWGTANSINKRSERPYRTQWQPNASPQKRHPERLLRTGRRGSRGGRRNYLVDLQSTGGGRRKRQDARLEHTGRTDVQPISGWRREIPTYRQRTTRHDTSCATRYRRAQRHTYQELFGVRPI